MTDVRGRAKWGAGQVARALICATFAVMGLVTGGCGSSTIIYGTPVITFSITPGPFASYLVYIVSITLTRTDGTIVEPLAVEERVDFTKLADANELFGAPAVPTGTYTSATVTIDYTSSQILMDLNGQLVTPTLETPAGAAVGVTTYTLKFDPANPLVIQNSLATLLDFNFDLSASTIVNTTVSPPNATVRPYMTVSTLPVQNKPIRARGLYVTPTNSSGSAPSSTTPATSFFMNTRSFFDISSNPFGALIVTPTDSTTYNINGVPYVGAAGLAAVNALPVSTSLAAYGSIGNLDSITPTFNATQIYGGTSQDSPLEDVVTGTVSSISGYTLNLHGAEDVTNLGVVDYIPDLTLYLNGQTIVSEDGQPNAVLSPQSISIGQVVSVGGLTTTDSSGDILSFAGSLVRMNSTHAWGTLNAGATSSSAPLVLLTLGDFFPQELTFTGTGSASGADADPTNYLVDTTGTVVTPTGPVDQSGTPAGTLVRMDGFVTAFGSAPPDFSATLGTLGSATEQELVIEWGTGGATAPFVTATASGLVVNITGASSTLGALHEVLTGPSALDLTNPAVNPTIVPDPTVTNQYSLGNPVSTTTAQISVWNGYSDFLTALTTFLNGTNSLQKLVALGHYDQTTNTFTAYRVDALQVQ
jgi:hypothetical protein